MHFLRHAIVFALFALPAANAAAQQDPGAASAEIKQALEEGEAGRILAIGAMRWAPNSPPTAGRRTLSM
jgi:hypothetical protein